MSSVTSIILTAELPDGDLDEALVDRPALASINQWLRYTGHGPLKEVSNHAGGTKAFQHSIWLGACNFLDEQTFAQIVRSAPWDGLEFQLSLKSDQETRFRLIC